MIMLIEHRQSSRVWCAKEIIKEEKPKKKKIELKGKPV